MKATSKVETPLLKKKVSAQRKKMSPKKAVRQNAVFLKVSTTKDKLDGKLKKITELHTKQSKPATASSDLVSKSFFASTLQLRPKFEVALLSPYRFPIAMDSQKIAVGVARYGGVLFVALGAITTLFFSQALSLHSSSQVAMVNVATTSTSTESQIHIDCTNPLQYGSLTCSTTVDKTPDAQFSVVGDTSVLSGSARVVLSVPFATSVRMKIRSEASGQFFDMGLMTSPTALTWESYLDTTKLSDGAYSLRAFVTNVYGTYEVLHSLPLTIDNIALPNIETLATSTALATDTDNDTENLVSQPVLPVLTVLSAVAPSEFRFEIETVGADAVKLYATQVATQKGLFIGTAYRATTNLWKYRWVASDFAEGEYLVRAQVVKDGVQSVSKTIRVTKKTLEDISTEDGVAVPLAPLTETKPAVTIDVQANLPLSGSAGLKIDVLHAKNVELFSLKEGELSERYLGVAKAVDSDTWVFYVNTKNIPNGTYTFVARVTNDFGTYDKATQSIKILNSISQLTEVQSKAIAELKSIDVAVTAALAPKSEQSSTAEGDVSLASTVDSDEVSSDVDIKTIEAILEERLKRLAVAVRFGDTEAVERIKSEAIPTLGTSSAEDENAYAQLQKKVTAYTLDALKKVEEKVATTNRIIEERTKEKATQDSDSDGIADYDEVVLFKTNPYVADSDADGFVDGAEIAGGYNPNDSSPESLILYESPKEAGVLKADTLQISSITTAPKETDASLPPVAIISGIGLPNSFISLYIFSTPVVVTVKTEEDGSWVYRFDKELDTGEHEVYVAVTDNAGKIVAKSEPFSFVKTAEAYTGIVNPNQVAQATATVSTESSFMSRYMIYLVLSISVVAIGLVLILLGIHLEARSRVFRESKLIEEKAT